MLIVHNILNVGSDFGILIGCAVVLLAWKPDTTSKEFKDQAIIKAILWGCLTFGALWFTDFRKFGIIVSHAMLANISVSYIRAYVITILVGLWVQFWLVLLMGIKCQHECKDITGIVPLTIAMNSLYFGYVHSKDQLATFYELQSACEHDNNRKWFSLACQSLATNINGYHGYLKERSPGLKHNLISALLQSILVLIKPYFVKNQDVDRINVNYMLATDFSAWAEKQDQIAFLDTGPQAPVYSHVLQLMHYANPTASNIPKHGFAIPVVDQLQPDWEQYNLPGAPACYLRSEPMFVEVSSLNDDSFGKKVTNSIRQEIYEYFQIHKINYFMSFTIPILQDADTSSYTIGVVNIEASDCLLTRLPQDKLTAELEILQKIISPYMCVLGLLVNQ